MVGSASDKPLRSAIGSGRSFPADFLSSWPALLALVVLVVNDQILKRRVPGAITGKLSDFAGLLLFPLILVAAGEVAAALAGRRGRATPASFWIAAGVTAGLFVLVKVVPVAASWYEAGVGWVQWVVAAPFRWLSAGQVSSPRDVLLVRDVTDLVAVPAVLGAVWVGTRWRSPERARSDRR